MAHSTNDRTADATGGEGRTARQKRAPVWVWAALVLFVGGLGVWSGNLDGKRVFDESEIASFVEWTGYERLAAWVDARVDSLRTSPGQNRSAQNGIAREEEGDGALKTPVTPVRGGGSETNASASAMGGLKKIGSPVRVDSIDAGAPGNVHGHPESQAGALQKGTNPDDGLRDSNGDSDTARGVSNRAADSDPSGLERSPPAVRESAAALKNSSNVTAREPEGVRIGLGSGNSTVPKPNQTESARLASRDLVAGQAIILSDGQKPSPEARDPEPAFEVDRIPLPIGVNDRSADPDVGSVEGLSELAQTRNAASPGGMAPGAVRGGQGVRSDGLGLQESEVRVTDSRDERTVNSGVEHARATRPLVVALAQSSEARPPVNTSEAPSDVLQGLPLSAAEIDELAATVGRPHAEMPPAGDADARGAQLPEIEVARVEPGGDMVVGGRAAPGAVVRLLSNGQPIGESETTRSGDWVILPKRALSPGEHLLSLAMSTPQRGNGKEEWVSSEQQLQVLLSPDGEEDHVTLVLLSRDSPSQLLQSVDRGGSRSAGDGDPHGLTVQVAEVGKTGSLYLAGGASPHAELVIRFNEIRIGRTRSDYAGRWKLFSDFTPGYRSATLRIEEYRQGDAVPDRVAEAPFELDAEQFDALITGSIARAHNGESTNRDRVDAPPAGEGRGSEVLRPEQIVIKRGDNLWTIASKAYGIGMRYTMIYDANRTQIVDPDMIFPGQVFVMPSMPDPLPAR